MEINHWLPLYPEITMLFSIGFILMTTLYLPPRLQWLNYRLSQIALIVVAFFSFNRMSFKPDDLLNGMFFIDPMACFLKGCISLLGCIVFFYARKTCMIKDYFKSQYFILCLFSILGMMIVISATHFLSLYLGLELMVLPLYALISLDRQGRSTEAALKYFLLGVL
ncbi:MAG: NADH:ubiquinone oxidoreductase subunit N, partial [Gammaproteobacteria bacterium]|nr:NADH:ubiquinone oxidoreductase subunit N [Gammaproteobacteria bacterium]